MYTVLTGAKKNIGDFLITDRAKKLLREHKPEHELFQLPHWESLESNIDKVNQSDAIIIMGGPGFQPHFYPGVYKLMPDINDIKPPIIPMGLGWKGFPGDYLTLKNYKFTDQSLEVLKKIETETEYISCRDYMTKKALKRNGLNNVLMTGCPVWYDLKSIGKEMIKPDKVNKIVFTPAQKHIYRNQSIEVMKTLNNLFPEAIIYCSFHRGITSDDKFSPKKDEENNLIIKREAEKLGINVVDTSFDLEKLNFYDDCDLHVGYRVHGHIYFLSKRKPSILLHEDGRGRGVSKSLNLYGIDAFERTYSGYLADKSSIPKLSGLVNRTLGKIKPNKDAVNILENYLLEEIDNNFARFSGVNKVIDSHYKVMKKFINSLP
ncbi:polysaccharide pyruvyl transferase family protein [Halanaerobium saccharolyticum]|uniref:polysaccharide pyruvyl transferase family protein n=1 Tax=Halanaerobium saccharolyticum TaxID=43595 RepID=UPI003FCE775B